MSDVFIDVPEIFEVVLGESLTARTEVLSTWRELGPPDLCHVVKSTGKSGQRDVGTYHYVSGVDASSSASVAAYINTLTYSVEETSAWFSSKSAAWRVRNACFCCFNAFSRVDMRVDVKIPGGVQAYAIDLRGERHEATAELWLETYLSAILRAIQSTDEPSEIRAYRKLDPITTLEEELRFLKAAEALFSKGWQVGSDPERQVATIVANHLTTGIMKYFGQSFRYQQAANLFEKLSAHEPEAACLLAESYIGMNEEVKGVQVMSSAIRQLSSSWNLLLVQCEFLRSKGRYDWALKLAWQAVNCAPSEYLPWEKITEVYIELGQYEDALLTLNSCPLFTFIPRDAHKDLTPARVNLPFDQYMADILPEKKETEDDYADPALLRLPAPKYQATWKRAYNLLTRLHARMGWDELLKTRSAVFVMEEEYRMQKAQADIRSVVKEGSITEDGSVRPLGEDGVEDDASTRAIVSPSSPRVDRKMSASQDSLLEGDTVVPKTNGIPIIKISSHEANLAAAEKAREGGAVAETELEDVAETKSIHDTVEKPASLAHAEKEDDTLNGEPSEEHFQFSNKRLCERWLDNLFMTLYEDLRVWTIFRGEIAHFKTQHVAYKKTGLEWEILGDLAIRLHHKEEAKEAYQRCLDTQRYSVKPWLKLMEIYADEGDLTRTLQTALRVVAYQKLDYAEITYPSPVAKSLYKIGLIHGHTKVSSTLRSMGLPEDPLKTMLQYLEYGQIFRVEGYDF